jgi:endonuclease-3
MAAAARTKSSDRAGVIKKLLPLAKKHYKVALPPTDLPVVETMLFAVCLENSSVEAARAAYDRLFAAYPDLNEARVSSITELQEVFSDLSDSDWRAFRCRRVLQYVFDRSFAFEMESLRKKTLELGVKQLAKIKQLTPFVRSYTLHVAIGAHLVPLDDSSRGFLSWLGLASREGSLEDAGESLKSLVRKSEAETFCASIRCLAVDPNLAPAFTEGAAKTDSTAGDASTAIERLEQLMKSGAEKYLAQAAKATAAAEEKVAKAKPAKKVVKAAEEKAAPKVKAAPKKVSPASADDKKKATKPAAKPAKAEKAAKPAPAKKKAAPKKPARSTKS